MFPWWECVYREILWSRHAADFGTAESSGFSPLSVLITLNPSDRSGEDKSHLNWDCS